MKRKEFFTTLGALALAPLAGKIKAQTLALGNEQYVGMMADVYVGKKLAGSGTISQFNGNLFVLELYITEPFFIRLVRKSKTLELSASDVEKLISCKFSLKSWQGNILVGTVIGDISVYYKYNG